MFRKPKQHILVGAVDSTGTTVVNVDYFDVRAHGSGVMEALGSRVKRTDSFHGRVVVTA